MASTRTIDRTVCLTTVPSNALKQGYVLLERLRTTFVHSVSLFPVLLVKKLVIRTSCLVGLTAEPCPANLLLSCTYPFYVLSQQ
jgi:hypothetical protein